MRFGLFYEHQLPRPWDADSEHRLLKEALEQVEIADRVGFDFVWQVEHHFLEEYSHSSAPEVFLAAAATRTRRIRLGHGIVQLPQRVNHPARVAERVATLDLISDGRVELGTGESSSAAELGGFGVDREAKRAMWDDAIDAITRMFVEEPFAGWDSPYLRMPPRNVVPKPLQTPHPPLWVACSRRETIEFAARRGIGALSFSFVEPEDAAEWVRRYYELIASPECQPAGFAVNPNLAVVLPMMCHRDEREAIERGIDGAHFFGYSLAHYFGIRPHLPGRTDVFAEFTEHRDEMGFARSIVTADQAPLGIKLLQQGLGSLRGAIGTPEQITDLVRRYEAVGVDQIGFVLQAGRNRHEHICESLELFGETVLPQFAEAAERVEADKRERLAPATEAALARRPGPRRAPVAYRIDEHAELERARARGTPRPGELAALARDRARRELRRRGQGLLERLVDGASDRQLERRFGSPLALRAMFTAMASAFEPRLAFGFRGDITYELGLRQDGAVPATWTITVSDGRAAARPGDSPDAAVRVRMAVADFARVAAGELPPARALLEGRTTVEGDLAVAGRLSEMFGGPSPY
jgi:alkanesulfonate monooxygenase SsuD/methylene tetrahydromethanopterin reductase-like flavin-dependent oxidoreductase (luciferase family)